MFADRADAGRQLAVELSRYAGAPHTIVLGIPRGGVVVAAEVARVLSLPLDVAVAAKVGAPGNAEYAIGAVAADGYVTSGTDARYSPSEIFALSGPAHAKVLRYLEGLRGRVPALPLAGATALVVDDGLATGLTARAAAEWVRREGARRVVVAVPVAAASAVSYLEEVADEVVTVAVPAGFAAVGQFYRRFEPTEDSEVTALLGAGRRQGN